jgi:hypothetical protein
MPIKVITTAGNQPKHFLNMLLHSDGHKYALGVKHTGNDYPIIWFVDLKCIKHSIDAKDLVELDTLPPLGTSPALKLWSNRKLVPYSAQYEMNYNGQIKTLITHAVNPKKAKEKALRWMTFETRKPFQHVHDYFNKHPNNFKEILL